jgi:hypothetical protein
LKVERANNLRVLIAAVGTGVLILPALAVARHSAEGFFMGEAVCR